MHPKQSVSRKASSKKAKTAGKAKTPRGLAIPIRINLVERRIHTIRDHQVMLDSDLAELYQVPTKVFNQAVKRNLDRFPKDFLLQLTLREANTLRSQGLVAENSRSQIVTLKQGQNVKYRPYAFTEQGVGMLSSILNSRRAVRVNIAIMRAFVQLRQIASTHTELLRKVSDMEEKYDGQFRVVFTAIKKLMEPPPLPPKRQIGFRVAGGR